MSNTVEITYKHIPHGVAFTHGDIEYTKTNFNRGFYFKDGRKVHRVFKKKTLVITSSNSFDFIPQ